MTIEDACITALEQANKPLHYNEITQRMIEQGLWVPETKTPERSVNSKLSRDILNLEDASKFIRTAPGVYGLRKWKVEEHISRAIQPQTEPDVRQYSFTDAAEIVLENFADKQPMHYRKITDRILKDDLVNTQGQTPEATLYAMILTEIRRNLLQGAMPRFVKHGRGMVGLRKWLGEGLAQQIEKHNLDVQEKLLEHLHNITPIEFEELIGRLLGEMGFEDIEVTQPSGDGGIDVRGVLVVGDAIHTKMAVQVKKWKKNVQAPIVNQVRGSLGAHEQGMIITTSDFSKGAQTQAAQSDKKPVMLVNGQKLTELLIEYEVLVKKVPYELIYLDLDEAQ